MTPRSSLSRRVRTTLIGSIASLSLLGAAASAQAVSSPTFQSKSGSLVCEYATGLGAPMLLCQSRPEVLTVILQAGSRPSAGYDGVERRRSRTILRTGAIWTRGSYRCQMGSRTIRCWSKGTKDDWAFILGQGSWRRYRI